MCVREREEVRQRYGYLIKKTTIFDAPKMYFEGFKREGRTISVGWFKHDLAAQGLRFLSEPDFCLLQTARPLPTRWTKQSISKEENWRRIRYKACRYLMGLSLPLSGFKSANNLRSLFLFATRMLTISAGLFWFATNSCTTVMIISVQSHI